MTGAAGPTILVADDDPVLRAMTARLLGQAFPGVSVIQVAEPRRVAKTAAALQPQLILLDWIFGHGLTGPALCRQLKSQPATKDIPVILMTGQRTALANRAETLRSGADLFLAKPFTRDELARYCQALLERGEKKDVRELFRLGPATFRREEKSVWLRGKEAAVLPAKLFELLWHLARRSPDPVSKADLVRLVWKNAVRDKHVDLAIARLRRKLPPTSDLLVESVAGSGYRLILR